MNFLLSILGALPVNFRRLLGKYLGLAFSFIPTRERKIAKLQIIKFLKSSEPNSVLRSMYAHLGITLMETLNLSPLNNSETIQINDPELLNELKKSASGSIALTAHTGNWDLLAAHMISNKISVVTAARQARIGMFNKIISELRNKYGIKVILRSEEQGARELLKALKSGACIAGLIDQDTYVRSEPVNFFGCLAATPVGLVSLAKRVKTLLVAAFIFREKSGKFKIFLQRLDISKSGLEILSDYNKFLELYLRAYPEQWVWVHKRWRTKEDGARLNSREYINWLEKI